MDNGFQDLKQSPGQRLHERTQSRSFLSVMRILVGLFLLLLIGEILIILYPPAYVLMLSFIGRSPVCTWDEAFRGAKRWQTFRNDDRAWKDCRLLESDPGGYHRWQTPHGTYWISENSDDVLPILIAQQENGIYGFNTETSVRPGDIVLDCGAHVGVFVRTALLQGAKLVVAIEPAPDNLECLRRNFAKEIDAGQVIVVPKGVWDKDDLLTLYVYPKNSAADSFVIKNQKPSSTATKVPLITIDHLVSELKLAKVDFIKMDIKGATERALQGADTTLRQFKPKLAISVEEDEDDPKKIISSVDSHHLGYRTHCGMCTLGDGQVIPTELFFLAP